MSPWAASCPPRGRRKESRESCCTWYLEEAEAASPPGRKIWPCACAPGEKLYLATLTDIDGEMEARIRDHQKMREGKHFHTVERGYALEELDVSGEQLVLLECMTNLLANEMYSDGAKKPADIPAYIMEGIRHLCSQTGDLIVIGQDAFSEVPMDPEMRRYVRESGRVSQMLAGEADVVVEVKLRPAACSQGGGHPEPDPGEREAAR